MPFRTMDRAEPWSCLVTPEFRILKQSSPLLLAVCIPSILLLAMKKITKYGIPTIVPILSILYGLADTYGWTNCFTGRALATAGLYRLRSGNGYPETFIYHDEKEFRPMKGFIDRNTRNPQVANNNKIQPPSFISVDAGLTRRGTTPPEWPTNVETPESAQIMYFYGQEKGKGGGTATWVGSILEMRQWIETSRNRERFWVTVVMMSFLSAWIGMIKARNSGERDTPVDGLQPSTDLNLYAPRANTRHEIQQQSDKEK